MGFRMEYWKYANKTTEAIKKGVIHSVAYRWQKFNMHFM